jgi:type VI secretion system protein ImpE
LGGADAFSKLVISYLSKLGFMTPQELFRAGKLDEAVRALIAEVKDHPADAKRRTFLFELLCFTGDFDRAEKHLEVVAQGNEKAELGSLVYRAAIHAERTRQEMFEKKQYRKPDSEPPSSSPPGTLNGRPFQTLTDADPRIGARLEVFAAGSYLWIPFEHLASVEMQAPQRLRDLIWAPAVVRTGPSFKDIELGEVLLPALSPFSWQYPDDGVRLGRATAWVEEDGEVVPVGQKMLLLDGEEYPFLELRKLEFAPASAAP